MQIYHHRPEIMLPYVTKPGSGMQIQDIELVTNEYLCRLAITQGTSTINIEHL